MQKIQVIVDKLNLRNTPHADPTFTNWTGELKMGEEFEAMRIVKGGEYNGTNYWYQDSYNRYASLAGFGNTDSKIGWGLRSLGVPLVWSFSKGENINVAVIDTGVDLKNEDLKSAVKKGYNMITDVEYKPGVNENCIQDVFGHGTGCATVIASRGNLGILGVAPLCNLIIIKIADDEDQLNLVTNLGPAIEKAVELGANIISISAGYTPEDINTSKTIERYWNDHYFIISGGNDRGFVTYPANKSGIISVGAIKIEDKNSEYGQGKFSIGDFSGQGQNDDAHEGITITAPGQDISVYDLNKSFKKFSGTSASAPFISGVAALYLAYNNNIQTSITTQAKLREKLITSTLKIPDMESDLFGFGIIDPVKLFNY